MITVSDIQGARFYADINYRWEAGDRYEQRYAIFDSNTKDIVARYIARQYATRRAAEKCADKLNCLEDACSEVH